MHTIKRRKICCLGYIQAIYTINSYFSRLQYTIKHTKSHICFIYYTQYNLKSIICIIGMCSTLCPQMDIFKRDYRPSKNRGGVVVAQPMVSNEDHFFSNLPPLNQKELKLTGNIGIFLTKEQRLNNKQAVYLQKQAKITE